MLDVNRPRLVTLLGHSGIGKSAVARSACHYLVERRYFRGGIIMIDMETVKSFQVLESRIKKGIIKNLGLSTDDSIYQKIKKAKDENFTEILQEFFDQNNKEL